jgi:hypothetical protein
MALSTSATWVITLEQSTSTATMQASGIYSLVQTASKQCLTAGGGRAARTFLQDAANPPAPDELAQGGGCL